MITTKVTRNFDDSLCLAWVSLPDSIMLPKAGELRRSALSDDLGMGAPGEAPVEKKPKYFT